jgi:hypothetical protein
VTVRDSAALDAAYKDFIGQVFKNLIFNLAIEHGDKDLADQLAIAARREFSRDIRLACEAYEMAQDVMEKHE